MTATSERARHLGPKLARLIGPRLEELLTSGAAGPEGEAGSAPSWCTPGAGLGLIVTTDVVDGAS